MNSHRKPTETMRDFFKREYDLCTARVEKYYVLQSLRRDQGYFGAALFYQNEAKRWHERAMDCRRQWLVSSWRNPLPIAIETQFGCASKPVPLARISR